MKRSKKPQDMTQEELERTVREQLSELDDPDFDPMAPHPTFWDVMVFLLIILGGLGVAFTLAILLIRWLVSIS